VRRLGLPAALVAGLALLPLVAGPYLVRLLAVIFMWGALASAWNLLAGYAGPVDLGPVVHYGLGGFTVAVLLTRAHWPFLPALAAAGGLAALVAYAVGTPTLRLRGAYFAVGTLALAEALREGALSFDRVTGLTLTGGSHGITFPLGPGTTYFYYVLLAILALALAAALWLEGSRFGYGLRAIRENEVAAAASGIDVLALKRWAYCLSAVLIAWVGGTAGYWLTYINANEAFGPTITFQMVVMAILGGLGTPFGPLLGAAVLVLLAEVLGTRLLYAYLIIIGLVIMAVSLVFPQGVVGLARLRLRPRARPAVPAERRVAES